MPAQHAYLAPLSPWYRPILAFIVGVVGLVVVPVDAGGIGSSCAWADDGTAGLVVDFGTLPAGASKGIDVSCVPIEGGDRGVDVLVAAGHELRFASSGLLCAIDGYPESGCGEPTGEREYPYWSYWRAATGEAEWAYPGIGPLSSRVASGAVEGWRYVVGTGSPQDPAPRVDPLHGTICAPTVTTTKPPTSVISSTTTQSSSTPTLLPPITQPDPAGVISVPTPIPGEPANGSPISTAPAAAGSTPQASTTRPEQVSPDSGDAQEESAAGSSDREQESLPGSGGGGTDTEAAGAAGMREATPNTGNAAGGVPAGIVIGGLLVVVLGGVAVRRFHRSDSLPP